MRHVVRFTGSGICATLRVNNGFRVACGPGLGRTEMSQVLRSLLHGIAAAALVAGLASSAGADEITLKGLSAFPKSHNNTKAFLEYIADVNKVGKGVVQIKYIGGPEVTPPPQQPVALRNGLFDIQYGPAAYYLGMFPAGDFTSGFKTPMESRKLGGYETVDKLMRKELGAHFIARLYQGLGLYMELPKKPPFRADGLPDLTGMKVRSSPAYRDFIKTLGGTPVVMSISQIYTALERGVVDAACGDLDTMVEMSLTKFLQVVVEPPFNMAGILMIANANKWDNLPEKVRDVLNEEAIKFEKSTMDEITARTNATKKELAKRGVSFLELKGDTAEKFVDTYMKTPWGRMRDNPKVTAAVVDELRKAWY
jgi:TRAP-type transport system periplasmic protein